MPLFLLYSLAVLFVVLLVVKSSMDNFADAFTQNLPEMLARDLAEQEAYFLARSITAGPPPLDLAYEPQPPNVPKRNPSRVSSRRLHHAAPETVLCSLKQNSVDSAWRSEREAVLKHAVSHCSPTQAQGWNHMPGPKEFLMKQGNDRDDKRLFLNGLDEDWGSESSADIEAGIASPSVRTRQQSITTAATSVDTHFISEGRRAGGCASVAGTPGKQAARFAGGDGESWVDFEIEALNAEENSSRGIESPVACQELDHRYQTRPIVLGMEDNKSERNQQYLISVPQRRSSRGRRVPTVILGETAHSRRACPQNFTEELASQLQLSPPPDPSHHFPSDHLLQNSWDEKEAAFGPVVPTGRRQLRHNLQIDLPQVSTDQLSLPPLSAAETTHYDAPPSPRVKQQQPYLLTKPLHSQSVARMPLFTNVNVHSWLQSSGGGHLRSHPIVSPTSPVSMSSPTNIRVSTEVLENLRIIVGNFPETMLRTSTLTVETVRSYSRKLKRGDFSHERGLVDPVSTIAESPTFPQQPSLGRKTSLGNLSLMSSLRGKFTSRFGQSATSPTLQENVEDSWPPIDHVVTPQTSSPPSRRSDPQVEACVNALRIIFPQGTDYILDALYAHVIVYNYINSLCGGLPHLHQNGAGLHLRTQQSKNFVLPPGVTSLADLDCQPDVSETVVRDFHDDAASIASKNVVPTKAASLLGLGSTNMGKPVKPTPGTPGGRQAMLRKFTAPGE